MPDDHEDFRSSSVSPAFRMPAGRNSPRVLLPAPPENFTGRNDEIKRLSERLLFGEGVAISAAMQGMGGVGKTALALVLAWKLKDAYQGGAVWVQAGPEAKRETVTDRLAFDLGVELKDEPDPERRAARVQQALGGSGQVLAIVDDVWDLKLGRWILDKLMPAERVVIVTSRKAPICRALCGQVERIDVLGEDDALELMAKLVGPLAGYEEVAWEVVELAGRLPLALKLVSALCQGGAEDLPRLARKLRSPHPLGVLILEGGEEREENLERCLALSYEGLDEDGRRRFRALGAFAQGAFGLGALAAVWGDGDLESTEDEARRLEGLALLARAEVPAAGSESGPAPGERERVYAQHGLLRAYALSLARAAGEDLEKGVRHALYYTELAATHWRGGETFWPQVEHSIDRIKDWPAGEQFGAFYRVYQFLALRGRWESYREWAEQLLTKAREERWTKFEASLLHHLGSIADFQGEKLKALDYYEQALPLRHQVGDWLGEAATLNNIGVVYRALAQAARALEYFQRALPLVRQVGDRTGEGATLNNIGGMYDTLGDRAEALKYFEQALPIRRQVGDGSGEAQTLNNIGMVYHALGEEVRALEYLDEALTIQRRVGDQAGEANTLNNMGLVYSVLGKKLKALEYYEQALPMQLAVGDRSGAARTLNNIGGLYSDLGEPTRALEYLEQALRVQRDVGDQAGTAITLDNIGSVYDGLHRYAKALKYFEKALVIHRHLGDRAGEGTTLHSIGSVYDLLGERVKALEYYAETLPIRRQVDDRAGEATTLNNIGLVYWSMGEQVRALEHHERALSLCRELGDRTGEATTLNNIGLVYSALGEKPTALEYYEQALPIWRQVGDRAGESATLFNMARLLEDRGELREAEALFAQVVEIRKEIGGPDLESDRKALDRVRKALRDGGKE